MEGMGSSKGRKGWNTRKTFYFTKKILLECMSSTPFTTDCLVCSQRMIMLKAVMRYDFNQLFHISVCDITIFKLYSSLFTVNGSKQT